MRRRAAAWALAALAACALTAAVVLAYGDRTVVRSAGFADRAAATTRSAAVRASIGRHVADAAIDVQPDLVAVRPLLQSVTESLIGTEAFRSLLRGAVFDVHRSVFDRDADTVTLRAGDAGILLAEALRQLQPSVAARVPARLDVRLLSIDGGAGGTALHVAERAQRVRLAVVIALVAAALLGLAALAASGSPRVAAQRLGSALAVVAGVVAAVAAVLPRVSSDAALGAVLATWLYPLAWWCLGVAAVGAVAALAAASIVRAPPPLLPALRRVYTSIQRLPVVRAICLTGLGAFAIFAPRTVLDIATVGAGVLLLLGGVGELLRLAAGPERPPRERRGVPRNVRIAAVATLLSALGLAAAALASGGVTVQPRTDRCNGHAQLCDRRLDDVAFVGTHNSMSADREPGWLFAAQDAGIPQQLQAGVRSLLIDTHYGFATPRGVATDLGEESISRAKVADQLSNAFVDTAERLRTRIGYEGGGKREVWLCHAFCEVGATRAVTALEQVHRFLVTHPEEVLILSIEDDTSAADTATVIRESGLIDEVYLGAAKKPWPTMRELIDRDERVVVMVENHRDGEPWMHYQSAVAQETPFHFSTPDELRAESSCDPNRGGTDGSLLLFNHWVDTSPAPRKSIAREVNAPEFLDTRLERCRKTRGMLPNIVAIDFYAQGDVFGAVDRLNGIG